MDKKFIWATTMNTEEGFAVAALDTSGCVQLHSEKETVDKITEILNRCNESYKKNFDAYNNALEMNTKSIVPDSVTYDYNKSSVLQDTDSRRTLQAMYTHEKSDFQHVTFYERRSVEDIEKITHEYKKSSDTIESLINTLKTKGIDVDLCRWLPVYTKFFPIEVYNNPLVKEPPISKDSPKKEDSLDKKLWTVTDTKNNKILVQAVNGLLVLDTLYSKTCNNINFYMAIYENIIHHRIKTEDLRILACREVWIDFNKTDDVALYRALEEVFKNKEYLKSRITQNGIETKYKFSVKKSDKDISDIAKKYYDSAMSFKDIKYELARIRDKVLLNGHKLNPEDFSRLSKLFANAGLDINIKYKEW